MKVLKHLGGIMLIASVLYGCIEPYDPPLDDKDVDLLVVDAFLNGSNGVATVKLSRSLPVKSTDPIPAQENAFVFIEDDKGGVSPLTPIGNGMYSGTVTNTDIRDQLRLVIRTGDEHEYVSGFTTIVKTPPIDSISWSVQRDGIRLEVNAHDPTGASRFFKWKFTETYEYHSPLSSLFMLSPEKEVVQRPLELAINYCWKTNESRDIIVGSINHLQQSVLNAFPITLIPYGSSELSVKYSILVQQQALTEETYNYWRNLEKSTEHLGGLFDPLPSEVSGNISCIHHEGERALGIFSAATLEEKRFFLKPTDLPGDLIGAFTDRSFCPVDTLWLEDIPLLPESALFVDGVYTLAPEPVAYTTSLPQCIDCRLSGGTTERPAFWE